MAAQSPEEGKCLVAECCRTKAESRRGDDTPYFFRAPRPPSCATDLAGATTQAVATAASVTKITVYRYFRSKEEARRASSNALAWSITGFTPPLPGSRREGLYLYGMFYAAIIFDTEKIELNRIVIAKTRDIPTSANSTIATDRNSPLTD